MAQPYSLDLRARIMNDYDSGVPVEDLVVHYEVSRSWLYSLIGGSGGSLSSTLYCPGRRKFLEFSLQAVFSYVVKV